MRGMKWSRSGKQRHALSGRCGNRRRIGSQESGIASFIKSAGSAGDHGLRGILLAG